MAFTLNEMESHWCVLSRGVSRSDLSFHRITAFCTENRLEGEQAREIEAGTQRQNRRLQESCNDWSWHVLRVEGMTVEISEVVK